MFNWIFAKDYLLHRIRAKTRHGVHSPFVYRLIDEVIYDFHAKKVYASVENTRKELLADERIITITDLGAGSAFNNNRKRRVGDIARNALKSPKLAQLLYRLTADRRPDSVIELGTCLGVTTLYLKNAAPGAQVYTLEGCPETAAIAAETFKKNHKNDIKLLPGDFSDTLPGVIHNLQRLDFVYIDGNHQKDATLKYFEWCLPKVHEDTLLIFDDIYWSEGMKQAWTEIKAHPRVRLTIDLFWIGLVYFKAGHARQDFKIRI